MYETTVVGPQPADCLYHPNLEPLRIQGKLRAIEREGGKHFDEQFHGQPYNV